MSGVEYELQRVSRALWMVAYVVRTFGYVLCVWINERMQLRGRQLVAEWLCSLCDRWRWPEMLGLWERDQDRWLVTRQRHKLTETDWPVHQDTKPE